MFMASPPTRSTVSLSSLLLLLLSTSGYSDGETTPTPSPWPHQFHSIVFTNISNNLSVVDLYYDWPNGRNFNIYHDQLRRVLYDVQWTNGTSFLYYVEEPQECTVLELGVGILRPNWMEGANYLGQEYMDGFLCNVWEKVDRFIVYYEDVVSKRPVYWLLFTGKSTHFMTFEVGVALEDEKYQAPGYCFAEKDEKLLTNSKPSSSIYENPLSPLIQKRAFTGL